MTDREIDEILRRGADACPDVDPTLLERLSNSIDPSLRPVRPVAPRWVLASGLFLGCAATALAVAAILGFNGIRALQITEITVIFCVLGFLTWMSAISSVGQMTPGRAPSFSALLYPAMGGIVLIGVFGALFHDYTVDHFVRKGITCLTAGLVTAVPAAITVLIVLRRGFAVNRRAAGLVIGTLGGFSGVTMLELHCANLQALHVVVWHTAVLPLAATAGAVLAAEALKLGGSRR